MCASSMIKKKKKYGAHSHVRATARLVNTHYSQQRSAVRSTAPPNNKPENSTSVLIKAQSFHGLESSIMIIK